MSYICWPNIAQKVKLDSLVIIVIIIIIVNIAKDPVEHSCLPGQLSILYFEYCCAIIIVAFYIEVIIILGALSLHCERVVA